VFLNSNTTKYTDVTNAYTSSGNEILTFKALPKLLIVPATKWPQMAYNFFKAVLAVYLLCGWPQFVRRQLNLRQRADLAKTEA
jgi:hypothetical protein